MIEVKAKLVRSDSATYATGEKVECFIEFTQKVSDDNSHSSQPSHVCEYQDNLAWASVQLHCYCKTSYPAKTSKTCDVADLLGRTTLDAVTQAPGDVILATNPKILFCDLSLKRGETRAYFFSEVIPRDGPPTYRGHDIKYFYKITIAMQRVKSKVQSLTVPIRVLPIPIIARPDELTGTEETNEELTPTNPFLEKRELTELEISWHHLKNITARRSPKFYRISNKRGFVGTFCLFKPVYKIGENIVGSIDFSNCKVRCVQFSVKLQSQEIPNKSYSNQTNMDLTDSSSSTHSLDFASIASGTTTDNLHKSSTAASSKDHFGAEEELSGKISTLATTHQVSYATLKTQVVVPIPLHVTPTFQTDVVDLRWRLHFEFVTSTLMDFGVEIPESGEVQAPVETPVETMIWNLPVTIYAANPLKIYSPSQSYSLVIK